MTSSTYSTTTRMEKPLTKKEIVERLFRDGQISFDEMHTLLTEQTITHKIDYTPPYLPDLPQFPPYPTFPPYEPLYKTSDPIPTPMPVTCSKTP